VLSDRSCWDALFLRFEPPLYHTSEHMRCMVWVESAVVTPAQGPQAANTVKVAKYYVHDGVVQLQVDRDDRIRLIRIPLFSKRNC
jgi:hypothetical protein